MKFSKKILYGVIGCASIVFLLLHGRLLLRSSLRPFTQEELKELFHQAAWQLKAGDTVSGRALYQKIIARDAQCANAYIGLGQSYEFENNIDTALLWYKKALACESDNVLAHVACAGAYFMLGDLARGFAEYEWRWKTSNMANLPKKWDGSDLAGKTILLLSESGLGDVIQFMRFARQLKERGARIVMQVPVPLLPLAHLCDYIDEVIAINEQPQNYDVVTSLQSVPYLVHTAANTIPSTAYLRADPALESAWKKKLAADHSFKIGVCWQAGGQAGHVPQGRRSIPLALFAPLALGDTITFYSLQKGAALEQLKDLPAGFKVISLGDEFDAAHGAFMDTAALMKNLDLVITIDTSVAHLSGALGVLTWTLLPYVPDPRWMLNRTDTPWYPSMQLFRQQSAGHWQPVIEEVAHALKKFVIARQLDRAHVLHMQTDYASARSIYESLAHDFPNSMEAQIALGGFYEKRNEIAKARTCYEKAVALAPQDPVPHICLSPCFLAIGDYARWAEEYAWRWHEAPKKVGGRWWDGSSVKGKKILLLEDNAFGDMIQFVRYARALKEQGAHVTLQAPLALKALFSSCCPYLDEVVTTADMRTFDYVYPLQLLPKYVASIPRAPYLQPPQNIIAQWAEKLKNDQNLKIGLCWQTTHDGNAVPESVRSVPLALCTKLAHKKGVSVYSLQKGADSKMLAAHDIKEFGPHFDADHGAFMDSAAIMKNLDLVITIDTAVAHLAGALGVPVWVILPYAADVRWMLDRSDTSWYSSMRLFRQKKIGDWVSVIHQVVSALNTLPKTKTR